MRRLNTVTIGSKGNLDNGSSLAFPSKANEETVRQDQGSADQNVRPSREVLVRAGHEPKHPSQDLCLQEESSFLRPFVR